MNQEPQFKKVYLATDHAGFELKNIIKDWLLAEGFDLTDCGAFEYDPLDDYPKFIKTASEIVAKDDTACAIIFGGSGQGEAMSANRFRGVRATVYYGGDEALIRLSREHNHANVLSLGARFVEADLAKRVIWNWLHTPPSGDEKHARRIALLDI